MANPQSTASNPYDINRYTGRFAPTPSGPLHFGSLVAALASYLDAHHRDGQWLVRMEDLDPPREIPGAADTILRQLSSHGLQWHGTVLYQSERQQAYQDVLEFLIANQLCYPCICNRQRLNELGGIYDSHCRIKPCTVNGATAMRLRTDVAPNFGVIEFNDLFQGPQQWNLTASCGDFIIKRKDKFFAYQLACAIDDIHQQVTHVIRGYDLLDSTPRQLQVMNMLPQPNKSSAIHPLYGHIPVAVNQDGQKLSKQNMAAEIDSQTAADNLRTALTWLNHPCPKELANAPVTELLAWATEHWQRNNIPARAAMFAP